MNRKANGIRSVFTMQGMGIQYTNYASRRTRRAHGLLLCAVSGRRRNLDKSMPRVTGGYRHTLQAGCRGIADG